MSNDASTLLQANAAAESAEALLQELTALVVEALNLQTPASEIDVDAPLFGEGLGLDSIDILEIGLVVSRRYAVQLRADSEENHRIFGSLRHLAGYIATQRAN